MKRLASLGIQDDTTRVAVWLAAGAGMSTTGAILGPIAMAALAVTGLAAILGKVFA